MFAIVQIYMHTYTYTCTYTYIYTHTHTLHGPGPRPRPGGDCQSRDRSLPGSPQAWDPCKVCACAYLYLQVYVYVYVYTHTHKTFKTTYIKCIQTVTQHNHENTNTTLLWLNHCWLNFDLVLVSWYGICRETHFAKNLCVFSDRLVPISVLLVSY